MSIFAPQRTVKKSSSLGKFFSYVLLGAGIGMLLRLVFLLTLLSTLTASIQPTIFYEVTRQRVAEFIYDPQSLPDWDSYKGKYDQQIHSEADAIKYINEMLAAIKDPYTRLVTREQTKQFEDSTKGEFTGVGLMLANTTEVDNTGKVTPDSTPVVYRVIEGSPADKAGIKDGDILIAVDGQPVKGLPLESVVKRIVGKAGTRVNLSLQRGTQPLNMTITRNTFDINPVTSFLTEDGIGYIRLDNFINTKGVEKFAEALHKLDNARALVLDLRSNGGGFIDQAVDISSMFIKEGTIVTISKRIPSNPAAPSYLKNVVRLTGTEIIEEYSEDGVSTGSENLPRVPYLLKNRPVVLLIDGHTASASEIAAGALQDNKVAIVMGTRSYGKGIGQLRLPHLNGTTLSVTVLRYFTPSGKWLGDGASSSKHGIDPDIVVECKNSIFTFGSTQDQQWQAALKYLRQSLSKQATLKHSGHKDLYNKQAALKCLCKPLPCKQAA